MVVISMLIGWVTQISTDLGAHMQWIQQKKFTVVTQFHAPNGELENIVQFYVQDGKRIDHQSFSGISGTSETTEFCAAQKTLFGDRDDFSKKGGLKAMGEALDRGMVLVVSLWDDISIYMNWLDSYNDCDPTEPGCKRGPCDPAVGKPETLREAHPDSSYSFLNLKDGDLDTTNPDVPPTPAPSPSPPGPTPPAPSPPAPTPVPSDCPGGSLQACIGDCPTNPTVFASCVSRCEELCAPATTTTTAAPGMCCWQDCQTMDTCLPGDACSADEETCTGCSGIWCPGSSLVLV